MGTTISLRLERAAHVASAQFGYTKQWARTSATCWTNGLATLTEQYNLFVQLDELTRERVRCGVLFDGKDTFEYRDTPMSTIVRRKVGA